MGKLFVLVIGWVMFEMLVIIVVFFVVGGMMLCLKLFDVKYYGDRSFFIVILNVCFRFVFGFEID